ncbi:MAG: DUF2281 domain-containing protein [Methanophagales archaeon]|nr:DUF2281 domain-containing protein [Methanophagales archaeon]
MAVKDLIAKEIEKVPESYHAEILDFIHFLETKEQKMETMFASESALKKDWLRPEEDEAWRDL